MRIWGLVTVGAVALLTAGCAAAAGESVVVSPPSEPVPAAEPTSEKEPTTEVEPTTEAEPTTEVEPEPSALTKPPSTCITKSRLDLKLSATDLTGKPTMCFKVGSTLRMQGIGPGVLDWTPENLASPHYEAGVYDVLFERPGTVTLKFDGSTIVVTIKR